MSKNAKVYLVHWERTQHQVCEVTATDLEKAYHLALSGYGKNFVIMNPDEEWGIVQVEPFIGLN